MSDEITLILEDHSDSILVEIVEEVTEVAVAATGEKGPPGTRFYLTDGVPTAALGVTADLALDTTTGILYRKASATTWVEEGTIATGAALAAASAVLTAAINSEVAARQAADTGLGTQLSEVAADIDAEAAERAAADIAETTARLTTDAGLTAQLGALTDDLTDEVTARTAADTGLDTRLTTVEDTLTSGVATPGDIAAEAASRAAADIALGTRIDGLAVADISGLIAALAAKATPADIATAIANLVASAPSTLDTLNELAAALGNDPNFATTITTLIGTKASQVALTALQAEVDDHEARIADLESHPGGVTTFNGRTGAVTPAAGDYAVADITGLPAALDGKMNVGDSAPLLGGTRRLVLLAPGVDDTDPGAGKISFCPDTSRLMVSLTDADGHDMTDFAANLGKVAAIVVIHSADDPSRWIAYRINEVWDVWDTFYTFTVTASKSLSGLTPTDGEGVQVYILPSGGGVRYGGATGQVPVKLSDNDFDLGWASVYTQGEIDDLLTAEATARANAVSTEATARAAADTALQANINAEATSRGSADTGLSTRIAALEAGTGSVASGTYLESGGNVAWKNGLTFIVGAASYYIDGVHYTSVQTEVTLSAADPSLDRVDVIALDALGPLKVNGTASASPFEPTLDPSARLRLTAVTVPAAASSVNVTAETIYADHGVGEWTATPSAGTITADGTTSPRTGTKCIDGTAVAAGTYIDLIRASTEVVDGKTLVFYVDPKAAWPSKKAFRLSLLNGATVKGTPVALTSGVYGFNSSVGGSYQQVVIPASAFAVPAGTLIDRLRIEVTGSGANVGFKIDDVQWQAGTPTTSTGTGLPKGGAARTFLGKNTGADYDASFQPILQSDVSGLPATLAAMQAGSYTYWDPDKPPTTPHASDEEFETDGAVLTVTGLTWQNQGPATAAVVNGQLQINSGTNSGVVNNLKSLLKNKPPTTAWTVTTRIKNMGAKQFHMSGIALRSTAGRTLHWCVYVDNTNGAYWLQPRRYTSDGVESGSVTVGTTVFGDIFLRVTCDGTNIALFMSADGRKFTQMTGETIASWLGDIQKVGIGIDPLGTTGFDFVVEFLRFRDVVYTGAEGGLRTVGVGAAGATGATGPQGPAAATAGLFAEFGDGVTVGPVLNNRASCRVLRNGAWSRFILDTDATQTITVDILKNGTSIFTSTKLVITGGTSLDVLAAAAGLTVGGASVAIGDKLEVVVAALGAGSAKLASLTGFITPA